ncbi:MAG: ferritin-like domain-containing protein [Ilumatobacteraceae bacterium]
MSMLHKPDRLDDRAFDQLIEESQDLHTDAMTVARTTMPDLADLASDRRRNAGAADPELVQQFEQARSSLGRKIAMALGGIFGAGVISSAFAKTASAADGDIDVMQLQTAVSLELLAVATYGAALTLPFIANGNPVIVKFAQTTMSQHDQHRQAFSAQTKALGGTDQTATNPKYTPIVEAAKPTLAAPIDVVKLAMTLEQVATETYLADLNRYTDVTSRVLMASVMGVECQHLATLRAVGALLDGGAPELIAIPLGADVAKLPAAAGSVAFPDAFEGITMASPPEEGAVK